MSPPPRRRRRNRARARRMWAIVTLSVVATATIGSVLLSAGGGDGDDETSSTTSTLLDLGPTTTLNRESLTDEGRELLDLVEAGEDGTYHVVYRAPPLDPSQPGATATTEIWQRGDQLRLESVVTDASGTSRRIDVGGPEGTVSCDEEPDVPLTCQRLDESPPQPTEDLLAIVLGLLPSSEVTVEDGMVGSIAARCFTLEGDETSRICLTPEGVLVLLESAGVSLEATQLDQNVTDEAFVPPAVETPAGSSTSTTAGG